MAAVAQHEGGGSEPERLPPTQGREGQAPKKLPATDAIFATLADKDGQPIAGGAGVEGGQVMRLSLDGKAAVKRGDYSRGGQPRGDTQAADHHRGCQAKHVPFGLVEEDRGQWYLTFGSAFKTSDFIVDGLEEGWNDLPAEKRAEIADIHLKGDNGPDSRGVRTPFLPHLVEGADRPGNIIQLLYYPPYHSKYHPIERGWGSLEQPGNGAKLVDPEAMVEGAHSMTWTGIQPVVTLSGAVSQTGVSLSKKAMRELEASLERNPFLPKWDILIWPA